MSICNQATRRRTMARVNRPPRLRKKYRTSAVAANAGFLGKIAKTAQKRK